ncbi:hypothetical protein [Xanthomonas campestris]
MEHIKAASTIEVMVEGALGLNASHLDFICNSAMMTEGVFGDTSNLAP